MRTTVDFAEDALLAARTLAQRERIPLGIDLGTQRGNAGGAQRRRGHA